MKINFSKFTEKIKEIGSSNNIKNYVQKKGAYTIVNNVFSQISQYYYEKFEELSLGEVEKDQFWLRISKDGENVSCIFFTTVSGDLPEFSRMSISEMVEDMRSLIQSFDTVVSIAESSGIVISEKIEKCEPLILSILSGGQFNSLLIGFDDIEEKTTCSLCTFDDDGILSGVYQEEIDIRQVSVLISEMSEEI